MAKSELPQEVLVDIFSRLPPKAVGRCRCLAKPWPTLLSTPEFLKTHFARNPRHQNLILITPSGSIHSIATTNAAVASTNLDFPNSSSEVAGSCDGLVLLVNDEQDLFLANPTTLHQVKIPDPPNLALVKDECSCMHGFGYDRSSKEYKIVTLSYYMPNFGPESDSECDDVFVDVYSVKTGVWTRVDSSLYDHAVPHNLPGAYVNGAIHWLASDSESGHPCHSVITAFDFVDEVFDEIPAPTDLDVNKFVFNRLLVLGGCLCIFDDRSNRRPDIWIMKEYGVGDSWEKFSVDADYDGDILKPLCFIGDEEIVLLTEKETLIVYNLKERTLRDMLFDGVPAKWIDGATFVETLVSPAGESVLH